MLQARGVLVEIGIVLAGALADARRADPELVGSFGDLGDQVVDDRVRGTGDSGRAARRDQLQDLPGGGERLPGPRWPLDGQIRCAEPEGQPDSRLGRAFAITAQR
jgi:hypothetical protein